MKAKTWERTKTPGLLRHKGGLYYARLHHAGKTTFVPLKTDLLEIARTRFAEHRSRVEKTRRAARRTKTGAATMGDLLDAYRARVAERPGIQAGTRARLLESADFLITTWSGFASLRPDEVTPSAVEKWRDHAVTSGTGFRPPGAKGDCAGVSGRSASSVNKAVDCLRKLIDLAVDAGAVAGNPLAGRRGLKTPMKPRKPELPEPAVLEAVFAIMEATPGRAALAAELCRFLAVTGCRLAEAGGVRWGDVDFTKGVLRVRGTKTASADRVVPLIPAARALLDRIRARQCAALGEDPPSAGAVLSVREGQKSLDRACAMAGAPRLTHHDLRDAFATVCIESGVDIPTVAGWLGHADGGALLMRVYGHHRLEHSLRMAQRVGAGSGEGRS